MKTKKEKLQFVPPPRAIGAPESDGALDCCGSWTCGFCIGGFGCGGFGFEGGCGCGCEGWA
jgi:hypothetical protein